MLNFITIKNFKILVFSSFILLSGSAFAQSESKETESTIVMTKAELESFLNTVANARRAQLKERESKKMKQDLADLRLKYNQHQTGGSNRSYSNNNNYYDYDNSLQQQVLRELRYLNQRLDNMSGSNTVAPNNRDNATIILPSNPSPSFQFPQSSGSSNITLVPDDLKEAKIKELEAKIDSLRNKKPVKNTFSDSLSHVKLSLQDIRNQMDSLEAKITEKNKVKVVKEETKVPVVKQEKKPEDKSYFKKEIYFDNNSSTINASYLGYVNEFIKILATYPEAKILLEGWASPKGSAVYNKQLSMRRSESVAKEFTSNGIDPNRIITSYKGEDTLSSEGRARRVDMAIIVK